MLLPPLGGRGGVLGLGSRTQKARLGLALDRISVKFRSGG